MNLPQTLKGWNSNPLLALLLSNRASMSGNLSIISSEIGTSCQHVVGWKRVGLLITRLNDTPTTLL